MPLILTLRLLLNPGGGTAGAADADIRRLAGQITALETANAADIHVQAVDRTTGRDGPGSAQVDGQALGGQVRQVHAPGAADGNLQVIGLEFLDQQGPGTREIHLLQVLDRHGDLDRPGWIDALAPIRLAVFDGKGVPGNTRGQAAAGDYLRPQPSGKLRLPCWMVISAGKLISTELKSATWRVSEVNTPEPRTEPLKFPKSPRWKEPQAGALFQPNWGAKTIERTMPSTIRPETIMRATGQRDAQDQPDTHCHQEERPDVHQCPQVFNRDGAQFNQNQIRPAAIKRNGKNKERFRILPPYFFFSVMIEQVVIRIRPLGRKQAGAGRRPGRRPAGPTGPGRYTVECHCAGKPKMTSFEETAEDDEQDRSDFHHAQPGLPALHVTRIKAHDEDAQADQEQDDGPAVGPAFPVIGAGSGRTSSRRSQR